MTQPRGGLATARRSQVVAWALWDCGATGVNAIVVTFVFSVYLTEYGRRRACRAARRRPSWLGRALTVAGLVVALLAPVDRGLGRRRRTAGAPVLAVLTGVVVAADRVDEPDPRRLPLPVAGSGAAGAAPRRAATWRPCPTTRCCASCRRRQTSGRISGFGCGGRAISAVSLLLLIVYVGFISGDGDTRGLLGIPAADGQNVRAGDAARRGVVRAVRAAAARVHLAADDPGEPPADASASSAPTASCGREVVGEWRRDHNIVYYLVASAVFRDGLDRCVRLRRRARRQRLRGLAAPTCCCSASAPASSPRSGAVLGGLLDDRVGSKPVIVGSLASMIAVGLVTLMALSGPLAFWVCGLLLCLFIGPTQSSARTLMLRMSTEGKEGVAFGLYTTTGRAVSFLAPWLFSMFIDVFGTDRAGHGRPARWCLAAGWWRCCVRARAAPGPARLARPRCRSSGPFRCC